MSTCGLRIREVAATVQHLVGVSDATVRGEAVEEKLMVAAGFNFGFDNDN